MTRKCKSSAALSGWVCEFLIVTLLLAGCGGSSNSPYGVGDLSKTQLPTVDANEPFPAMSSEMVDAFIVEIPDLGKHRDEVLAAERDAINGILTELRAKSRAGNASALTLSREIDVQSQTAEGSHPLKDPSEWHFSLIPAANAQGPSLAGLGGVQQYLIGHQIGFFMVDGEPSKSDRGTSKTVEMKDGGTVQAVVELSVNKDGSVSLDLTTKVSMPVFGLDANSKVKLTGNLCPDADGKLDLKIESGSNGRAGSAGSVIYDKSLNARIRASVNDDAEVAGMDVDLNQGTRSTAGGRQVYV
ncbi:MAG: hypothetical protein ACJ73D_10115, partial [Pyrinomonadaceae bacterium]